MSRRVNVNSIRTYNEKVKPKLTQSEQTIYDLFRTYGKLSSYKIGKILGKDKNFFSGRLTALKDKGIIRETAGREQGCTILELIPESMTDFQQLAQAAQSKQNSLFQEV